MKFLIQMNILSNSADSDEDNDGLGSESDEENTIIKTQMHKHGGRSLGET